MDSETGVAAVGVPASEVAASVGASGGREAAQGVAEVFQLGQGLVSFPLKKACCC